MRRGTFVTVMTGLVPAIHVFLNASVSKMWMPGTSLRSDRPLAGPGWPGMTKEER